MPDAPAAAGAAERTRLAGLLTAPVCGLVAVRAWSVPLAVLLVALVVVHARALGALLNWPFAELAKQTVRILCRTKQVMHAPLSCPWRCNCLQHCQLPVAG